jgi:ATPase subunit of ABC transporter with duplicated ATPase domains
LKSFDGAVLAVSHDESFVNNVITGNRVDQLAEGTATTRPGEIWALSKQKVTRFEGTFKDYKNAILKTVVSGLIAD